MVYLSGHEGEFYFCYWKNCFRDLHDQMICRPFFHLNYLNYYLDYSVIVVEELIFVAAVASVRAADADFVFLIHCEVLIVIPVASDLFANMN